MKPPLNVGYCYILDFTSLLEVNCSGHPCDVHQSSLAARRGSPGYWVVVKKAKTAARNGYRQEQEGFGQQLMGLISEPEMFVRHVISI